LKERNLEDLIHQKLDIMEIESFNIIFKRFRSIEKIETILTNKCIFSMNECDEYKITTA